ncbi:MAG: putative bifunctional diguanylate cyclase/phosphodiesterase [Actinomycetota bacterium]
MLAAMVVVFLSAALAQWQLENRADDTRRVELALTRIQSRASLESLLQQRALDTGMVTSGLTDSLQKLDREIRASLVPLSPDEGLDDVRVAVRSHQSAVGENLALVEQEELADAAIHDREKVDRWFEELARAIDGALAEQRAVAATTDELSNAGSLAALFIACLTVGVLLWRFERARLAAASAHQRGIAESEARFRTLVQNSSDVVAVVDGGGRVSYLSPSAVRTFGRGPGEVLGRTASSVIEELVHPDDRELVGAFIQGGDEREVDDQERIEFRLRADDGWRVVECSATDSLRDPCVSGVVITMRDISRRKALEDKLRHQAFHDSLTHLPNRALLLDRLEMALARRSQSPLAVMLLDLDGFKAVNDSLGHAAGDQLLVHVAHRLQQCVRAADSVARLGGDEFAVLLEDLAQMEDASLVARRMLDFLTEPFVIAGKEIFIHASIGIVRGRASEHSAEELLRDADVAMYVAKTGGKNDFRFFQPSMRVEVVERLTLEGDLRAAVDRNELALFFQPLVDLPSGRISGMEALVRWNHPTRGLIPPADFIPLAEETGLIVPLGRWILRAAFRQLKQWQGRHEGAGHLGISVNLSGRQLQDASLVDDIRQMLLEERLDASGVTLEITESVLMHHTGGIADTLTQLRSLGLHLAIDDFGTGYSSLGYLQAFPIETLKIDRSFVARVGHGPEESALARAVVKLAQTLELGIVAEGIEEQVQLDRLRDLGCPLGQGYLFSRPLPGPAMEELLERNVDGSWWIAERPLASAG